MSSSAGAGSECRKTRPGGRTQRHTEAIYETTLSLLTEKGYGAIVFNDIAEAAGVSRSTLYRRWSSRAELVLDAIGVSLVERIIAPDMGSLVEDMRATLRQVGDYIATPLGAAVLVASIEIEATKAVRSTRSRSRLADFDPMFDRAVARGEIPADFDREAGLALADGAIYFRRIFEGEPNDEAWIDRVITLWRRVLSES